MDFKASRACLEYVGLRVSEIGMMRGFGVQGAGFTSRFGCGFGFLGAAFRGLGVVQVFPFWLVFRVKS